MADYDGGNTTGFRSPAGDDLEQPIDLAALLDLRRPHRYVVRVDGDGLRRRGIHRDDVLILDTSAPPAVGKVCLAFVHGDVVVAELIRGEEGWLLRASGDRRLPVAIQGEGAELWGIVVSLVRPVV